MRTINCASFFRSKWKRSTSDDRKKDAEKGSKKDRHHEKKKT